MTGRPNWQVYAQQPGWGMFRDFWLGCLVLIGLVALFFVIALLGALIKGTLLIILPILKFLIGIVVTVVAAVFLLVGLGMLARGVYQWRKGSK
ncbi:MAG: hypothetical protein P9M14_14035 [Candidatus Alcyoniella australis]|nr:hypothetical protein [Candidatus Alcyoniella australis]